MFEYTRVHAHRRLKMAGQRVQGSAGFCLLYTGIAGTSHCVWLLCEGWNGIQILMPVHASTLPTEPSPQPPGFLTFREQGPMELSSASCGWELSFSGVQRVTKAPVLLAHLSESRV